MLLDLWFHHDYAARHRKAGGGEVRPAKRPSVPFFIPPVWQYEDPPKQPVEQDEALFFSVLARR